MKMRIIIFSMLLLFSFLWNSNVSNCQPILKVSGIMFGQYPLAVVDDRVVTAGDEIEGFKVEEIGADFVRFSSRQGGILIKRLEDSMEGASNADKQKALLEQAKEVNKRMSADNTDYEEICVYAQAAVLERLKSPGSAKINHPAPRAQGMKLP